MTNLDDLVRLVEDSPTNPICRAMLTDALVDERDMLPTEADIHVLRIAVTAYESSQIRRATALLSDGTSSRRWLLARIYRACAVPRGQRPCVMVDGRCGLNIATTRNGRDPDEYWGRTVITAGAPWILHAWACRVEYVRCQRIARRRQQQQQ